MAHRTSLLFLAVSLIAVSVHAQQAPTPQPVAGVDNLLRLEGTDAESGIHYVRLMLSLSPQPGDTQAPPRFTVECTDVAGKHDMGWLVSFGGVTDTAFTPPFHPTPRFPHAPKPIAIKLTMTFEGYMKWKPITRSWARLPSGELRYMNPGMKSPNMESLRYFLTYLRSLPGLRIRYANAAPGLAEELFQTRPLLDEMAKTPICQ